MLQHSRSRRNLNARYSVVALAVIAALASQPARAVDIVWSGGIGDWYGGTWAGASAPNGASADVFIDSGKAGSSSSVRLVGTATIRNLTIDTGDALTLSNGSLLNFGGSSWMNNGLQTLASTGNWTGLRLAGDTLFTGNGTTTLSGTTAFINANSTATKLTIDNGYTVRGAGYLGYDPTNGFALGAIINRGTVIAEGGPLDLYGSSFDNTAGSVQVASGATLYISASTSFNNTGSVVKLIDGATLQNGGSFTGGTIQVNGNARLVGSTYSDITLSGTANVANGDITQLSGTINGSLNLVSAGNWTGLRLAGDTLFTGNGTTTLSGAAAFINANSTATKLTIDNGYTVRGAGYLGYDPTNGFALGAIINRGTVIAEGGTLSIYGTFTGPGSLIAKAASTLSQQGGSVQTHLLDLSAGGAYQLASGTFEANNIIGTWSQTGGTFAAGVGLSATEIAGNYTANSSATLALNLGDGLATSARDSVHITGTASLANAHLNLSANAAGTGSSGFVAHAGDVFSLLTVDGARSGQFASMAEGAGVTLNGQQLFLTYLAGDGNDVALVSTLTPGSVNIAAAGSNSNAYVTGSYTSPNSTAGQTVALQNLDILPGGNFTLGAYDTLNLNGGTGTLSVSQGSVFTGNGVIQGHVRNAGLVRIPIVALQQVTGGRVVIAAQPVIASPTPVVVNAGTYVGFSYGGGGGGGTGGGTGGGGGGSTTVPPSGGITVPQVITLQAAAPVVMGAFAVDASLAITGSYTQESAGMLRLFVGGNTAANFGPSQSGGTYSQLFVGEQVALDGELQIVLQPELFAGFGYTPHLGDTFDFVMSKVGVSLASGLNYSVFVTAEGKDKLKGLTFSQYSSGYAGDPDSLYRIGETMFSFALVDGGHILRGTLVHEIQVTSVPEPSSYLLMLLGGAALAGLRRRQKVGESTVMA